MSLPPLARRGLLARSRGCAPTRAGGLAGCPLLRSLLLFLVLFLVLFLCVFLFGRLGLLVFFLAFLLLVLFLLLDVLLELLLVLALVLGVLTLFVRRCLFVGLDDVTVLDHAAPSAGLLVAQLDECLEAHQVRAQCPA